MKVNIITIGKTNHSKWNIGSEFIKVAGNNNLSYFLESEDKKVLQKIKLGGNANKFTNDINFVPESVVVNDLVTDGEISTQEIDIPFNSILVNPKNLNPFLADYNPDMTTKNRIVILLLGTDYSYIRSNINHDIGEIICTFHTPSSIACIISVNDKVLKGFEVEETSLIMVDTKKKNNFTHFRVNMATGSDDIKVIKSVIKKPDLVKRLESIDQKFTENKVNRRFVRYTSSLITSYYICPSNMSMDDLQALIDHHPISDTLDVNIPFASYQVNVDERGSIINDSDLAAVVEDMKNQKVKAFTLIGCRSARNQFDTVKPLYIFSLDATEDVTNDEDVKLLKCIKSN